MSPTDELIRLSNGKYCAAWGGEYRNHRYYYHFLNGKYEDANLFRHVTKKDIEDLNAGRIQFEFSADQQ